MAANGAAGNSVGRGHQEDRWQGRQAMAAGAEGKGLGGRGVHTPARELVCRCWHLCGARWSAQQQRKPGENALSYSMVLYAGQFSGMSLRASARHLLSSSLQGLKGCLSSLASRPCSVVLECKISTRSVDALQSLSERAGVDQELAALH